MQWSFARWIPDDSKELNEICSNSRKAHTCNSILSQTSDIYTQNLTSARYSYLLFMGLHPGRLPPTACLWVSLRHLKFTGASNGVTPAQENNEGRQNIPTLLDIMTSASAECLPTRREMAWGPLPTMPPTDRPWIFWNCWLLVLWTFLLSKCLQSPKLLANCLAAQDLISPSGQVT